MMVGRMHFQAEPAAAAGFDEGILSLCRPISLLYGESLQVQQMSVTNDRAPSYENRPSRPTAATWSSRSASLSRTASQTHPHPRATVKRPPPTSTKQLFEDEHFEFTGGGSVDTVDAMNR